MSQNGTLFLTSITGSSSSTFHFSYNSIQVAKLLETRPEVSGTIVFEISDNLTQITCDGVNLRQVANLSIQF